MEPRKPFGVEFTLLKSMKIVQNQTSTQTTDIAEAFNFSVGSIMLMTYSVAVATLYKQYLENVNFYLRLYACPK